MELLNQILMVVGNTTVSSRLAHGGPHQDVMRAKDITFVIFNKCVTAIFTYHLVRLAPRYGSQNVEVEGLLLTAAKQMLLLPLVFIVYDFFYSIFHWILHKCGIYNYVHKHHHQQHAPSRGQIDAINVHPFEFLVGEYNHLFALIIVGSFFPIHPLTAFVFILTGGIAASLNHTRFNVKIGPVYAVAYHDLHHWQPKTNFGQYTMFWDYVFGWFKPYEAPK